MGKFPTRQKGKTMRTFNIPTPPNDLKAVKDWQGYVWVREENSDNFTHQFPDAYTPTVRTWWDLIGEGALTECEPKVQNYYL